MPSDHRTNISRRGLGRIAVGTLAAAMVGSERDASAQTEVDAAESMIAEVVKTRGKPKGNADAACNAHIACHAANVALHLGRTVKYDNTTHEFVNDVEANRLRSEALREPWRL